MRSSFLSRQAKALLMTSFLVSPLFVSPAFAGDVTMQAVGSEFGIYDSNPLMLTKGAQSLWGSTTTPELILDDKTPTSDLNFDGLINENLFNQSNFNSTDVHAGTSISTRVERWSASLKDKIDYDTTRTSELTSYGLNITPVRHTGLSIAPDIAYMPTSVDKIDFQTSAQSSHYNNSIYTNYYQVTLTPTYTHNFDEKNTGIILLNANRYKSTEGDGITVDSFGPSFGWATTISQRLTVKATVGAQTTRQYGPNSTSTARTWDYVYALDGKYIDPRDVADVVFSRNEYPFGNGTEALFTSLSASDVHTLNTNFSLTGGVSYLSATYQSVSIGSLDSQYSVNGGLIYHATDHIDVTGTYQYRYETQILVSGHAADNSVMFGVTYRPKTWTL